MKCGRTWLVLFTCERCDRPCTRLDAKYGNQSSILAKSDYCKWCGRPTSEAAMEREHKLVTDSLERLLDTAEPVDHEVSA